MYSRLVHLPASEFVQSYAHVFDDAVQIGPFTVASLMRAIREDVTVMDRAKNCSKWVNQPFNPVSWSHDLVLITLATKRYSQCVVFGDMRAPLVVVAFSGGFNARCALSETAKLGDLVVHAGPNTLVNQFMPSILSAVACVRAKVGATKVVVTGASLGGSLATLCAIHLENAGIPAECVVFSCPPVLLAGVPPITKYVRYHHTYFSRIQRIRPFILPKLSGKPRITVYGMEPGGDFRTSFADLDVARALRDACVELHPDKPTEVTRWTRCRPRTWKLKRRAGTKKWRSTRIYRKGI
jgi:hypothetical protein